MRSIMVIGLVIGVALLSGCANKAGDNLAKIIEALGKDPATVCATVMTEGVSASFARTNITNGDVQCDKLTVKSTGTTTVPVTVKPVTQ